MRGEQAQLVSLSCPHCGGRDIESSDDSVFFFCRSCKAVVEPKGGELTLLPCLWERPEKSPPDDAIYVPFWMFKTDVTVNGSRPKGLALPYPADFMIPASIPSEKVVSIIRLGHRATKDGVEREYSTSKLDLAAEPGRYTRYDAFEAVELIFLSIERGFFSGAPGAGYEVKPQYKNLCFILWEKNKLDLLYVPDEHLLSLEPDFAAMKVEKEVSDIVSVVFKRLSSRHFGVPHI